MAKIMLKQCPPFDGCELPIDLGGARLDVFELGAITAIMPLQGQAMAVASALKSTIGSPLPKVGTAMFTDVADLMWFSPGQWLAFSKAPEKLSLALRGLACLTDQSDGFVALHFSGDDMYTVLARLCPLDFATLQPNQVARSDFAHVAAIFWPDANGMRIILPRSFAMTGYASIINAMKSIAAQRLL